MKAFVAIVAGVFVVGLLLINVNWREPMTPAERAAYEQARIAEIAAEHNARMAELEAQRAYAPLRETASTIALVAFLSLVPLTVIGVGYFVAKRRHYTVPRQDGRLPVDLRDLSLEESLESVRGIQARDLAHASNTGVPQSISTTYAPRLNHRQGDTVTELTGPAPQAVAPLFSALPFDPASVILGMAGESLVSRSWDDMTSTAVGGKSGSGKTWTVAAMVLQALLAGHRVILIDPDGNNPDGLAMRLAPVRAALWRPPAITPTERVAAYREISEELERRGTEATAELAPVTVIVDEWTSEQRSDHSKLASDVIEDVAERGRKRQMRVVVAGQRWSAQRAGGTDLRGVIRNVMLHQMRRDDARMLSGWPAEELPDASKLAPGEAFVLDEHQIVRVTTPQMSDIEVANFARGVAPLRVINEREGNHALDHPQTMLSPRTDHAPPAPGEPETGGGQSMVGAGSVHGRRMVEALDMFDQGHPQAACIDHLLGKRDRRSSRYTDAKRRFERALRERSTS